MIRVAHLIACSLLLGGCADKVRDFAREPHLSPIGAGLTPDRVAVLAEPPPPPTRAQGNSVWQDGSATLFRDPRAEDAITDPQLPRQWPPVGEHRGAPKPIRIAGDKEAQVRVRQPAVHISKRLDEADKMFARIHATYVEHKWPRQT